MKNYAVAIIGLLAILHLCKDSVYFAAKMLTATAWLELMCCQSEAWQKRSKIKKINPKAKP